MEPKVAEARGRVFDEWRENIHNGPGVPKGRDEATKFVEDLYHDAYVLAVEVDRLTKLLRAK